jgi:Alr-MurF fusion protein
MIRFSQLAQITGGHTIHFFKERDIAQLLIDSRKVVAGEDNVFFAIGGQHHNGHDYIHSLYQQGIRQFIVEQPIDIQGLGEANVLQVKSSVAALQALAADHRQGFTIPIIGITGSNGKTIVKEWLYQLLSKSFTIVKNPGSYNSQLGVPLSVWQLQPHHELGIFEAGISRKGEMEKLAAIIKPTIGIFTNIGPAHDEGFASLHEKIREKLRLFKAADKVIYCHDHALVHEAIVKEALPALSWGFSEGPGLHITREAEHYRVSASNVSFTVQLPFTDAASIENCFHCITVMHHLSVSVATIQESIHELRAIPMRLELKEGINQCQIIDDSYNNDLAGLQISLEFLSNQSQKTQRRLILSDILQSGQEPSALVARIQALVVKNKIDHFVGIGSMLLEHRHLFDGRAQFFASTQDFLEQFDLGQLQNEAILVKGARPFQFEKITRHLQRKVHGTVMEIDMGALVHNLNFFRSKIKPSTQIMVMVKAFAYGSGSTEIANLLQYHKVNYLGVAYADEGIELRKNNISLPIMVMNPSEESFAQIAAYNLEPEVYSFKILQALLRFQNDKPIRIHLKLDTGMHRLGFERKDLAALIDLLRANPHLQVATIFTHLAGADEKEHDVFSRQQAQDFVQWADQVSAAIGYKPPYHALNSPGILRLPDLQMDMVRLGIGLYGVDPTPYKFDQLRPVTTLKTLISQIKHIPAGETIGYSRRGKAEKDLTLATIAIGYADGFSRAFSRGVGEVIIRDRRAQVIGNVCMDMTMVDITHIPDAREGDEVIVYGGPLPIQEIAARIHTIPYEILTSTSERVKRVFVAESI